MKKRKSSFFWGIPQIQKLIRDWLKGYFLGVEISWTPIPEQTLWKCYKERGCSNYRPDSCNVPKWKWNAWTQQCFLITNYLCEYFKMNLIYNFFLVLE